MTIIMLTGFAITISISLIVYLLSRFDKKIYKFIPPILWLILSIIFMIKANYFSGDWTKFSYSVLILLSIAPTIISLIIAVIINFKGKNLIRR